MYHQVGLFGLLFAGELPRFYPAQRRLVHAPLLGPYPPPLLGYYHGDRVIEVLVPPGLEEEGYLRHEQVRAGRLDAPVGLAAHQGMEYAFEVGEGPGVAEDLAPQRLAVDAFLAPDPFAEAFDYSGDGLPVVLKEVVDDLVGRGRLRAELTEEAD